MQRRAVVEGLDERVNGGQGGQGATIIVSRLDALLVHLWSQINRARRLALVDLAWASDARGSRYVDAHFPSLVD